MQEQQDTQMKLDSLDHTSETLEIPLIISKI